MTCPKSGSILRKSTQATSKAANSRPQSSPNTKQQSKADSRSLRTAFFAGHPRTATRMRLTESFAKEHTWLSDKRVPLPTPSPLQPDAREEMNQVRKSNSARKGVHV